MRLLNTSTLQVEEFVGQDVPEYVILSHTWEDQEVSIQDIQSGAANKKKGYEKIKKCCERATNDGFLYCWIDTCCIDKTSSSELSEAINSMYLWYKNARICYVYLADFEDDSQSVMNSYRSFTTCRWWTRGWTLQELLAPNVVEFYSANWVEIGTKLSLQEQITEITGIDEGVLRGADFFRRNVAVRMSWAARRKTSRIEDEAYCLMGLFGVNMPLLYGEGNRAFIRLQEEIMRVREDYTLFAWSPKVVSRYSDSQRSRGLLASSPSDFLESNYEWTASNFPTSITPTWGFRDLSRDCTSLLLPPNEYDPPYLTSRGLRISLPLLQRDSGEVYACITLLKIIDSQDMILCIPLHRLSPKSERYIRRVGNGLTLLPRSSSKGFKYKSIYVMQPPPHLDAVHLMSAKPIRNTQSLLFAKFDPGQDEPVKCYLSSFISMSQLLTARFGEDDSDKLASSSSANVTESVNSGRSGNLYLHRLNKLVNETINMKRKDFKSVAMHSPPELCWLSDAGNPADHRGSAPRGILGFGSERYPNCAFLVQFGLFEDRPLCNVVPTTIEKIQNETSYKALVEDAQLAALHHDRITIHLNSEVRVSESDASPGIAVTVSIRRVASAFGIVRYMLAVKFQSMQAWTPYTNIERSDTMSTWSLC